MLILNLIIYRFAVALPFFDPATGNLAIDENTSTDDIANSLFCSEIMLEAFETVYLSKRTFITQITPYAIAALYTAIYSINSGREAAFSNEKSSACSTIFNGLLNHLLEVSKKLPPSESWKKVSSFYNSVIQGMRKNNRKISETEFVAPSCF